MSGRPFDLLIVGELNVDIILSGDVMPRFGQVEKLIDDLSICTGSSSGIFAAGAAKMGLRVLFVSTVGDDLFGHFVIKALSDAGVDTSLVRVDPTIKTGVTVVLSRGQDRAMLTHLGSIAAISDDHLDPCRYGLARHLHVASPFLLAGLREAMPAMMRAAKVAGMSVSLDPNWDPEQRWALSGFFDYLDVFLPNDAELRAIAAQPDLELAIAHMASRVPVLAIKRGAKGAIGVRDGERIDLPAFPVEVVDSTGAGDSFDAGFLAGWLGGESLKRCLQLGAACGALTTTRVGGLNGQPSWDEAVAFVLQHRP